MKRHVEIKGHLIGNTNVFKAIKIADKATTTTGTTKHGINWIKTLRAIILF
jgi:hypothetical protein